MTDEAKIRVIKPTNAGIQQEREIRDTKEGAHLLQLQHEQIRELLAEVDGAVDGQQRREAFARLRALLSKHEAAEEMVLRPVTRRLDGDDVADRRMHEENEAKDALARLDALDPASAEFADAFTTFRRDVEQHAEAEEREEFPLIRENLGADERSWLADALRGAETGAPSHPHPSADTTAKNWFLGPIVGVVDHLRDALLRRR